MKDFDRTKVYVSVKPKNKSKMDINKLTPEQVDNLMRELYPHPTKEQMAQVMYFVGMHHDFVLFVIDMICETMQEDGEEVTKEKVTDELSDMYIYWGANIHRMFEMYGSYLDVCKEKGIIVKKNEKFS